MKRRRNTNADPNPRNGRPVRVCLLPFCIRGQTWEHSTRPEHTLTPEKFGGAYGGAPCTCTNNGMAAPHVCPNVDGDLTIIIVLLDGDLTIIIV